ncbi:MAG: hypothetical protein UZ09_BCD002002344 [Bacteroidetes bacterium OLB9]|nr:MAG: hypothetical protein UZ09_BCD002002344 [Bacteroidetes bacterium OLB9]
MQLGYQKNGILKYLLILILGLTSFALDALGVKDKHDLLVNAFYEDFYAHSAYSSERIRMKTRDIFNYFDHDSSTVLAIFFHGAPFGHGQQNTIEKSGYAGQIFVKAKNIILNAGKKFRGAVIAPGIISESSIETSMQFIKKYWQKHDKILLYGYSNGGNVAVNLARALRKENMKVDFLVIVDSSDGPFCNITLSPYLPDNIVSALNAFQTSNSRYEGVDKNDVRYEERRPLINLSYSKGFPYIAYDPEYTNLINVDFSGEGVNHRNIQQVAEEAVLQFIRDHLTEQLELTTGGGQ